MAERSTRLNRGHSGRGQAGTITAFTGYNANLPPGFIPGSDGKFTTSMGLPTVVNLVDNGISATAVWNAPGVDLTSISAYRHQFTNFYTDLAASSVPSDAVSVKNYKHFTYQELRAVSTDAGPFHFLGGATFLHNDFTGNTLVSVLTPLYLAPLTHVNTYVKDESVYAQVGYDFTEKLNLTVSGRYIHETNDTGFLQPVASLRKCHRIERPALGDALVRPRSRHRLCALRPRLQGGRCESGGLADRIPRAQRGERVRTGAGGYLRSGLPASLAGWQSATHHSRFL